MSANALTQSIVNFLNVTGYKVWSTYNGAVYDTKKGVYRKNPSKLKGVSDIIGFRKSDGKHIEVEVKFGKDIISQFQNIHQQDLIKSGCICIVAKTLDQFFFEFKNIKI